MNGQNIARAARRMNRAKAVFISAALSTPFVQNAARADPWTGFYIGQNLGVNADTSGSAALESPGAPAFNPWTGGGLLGPENFIPLTGVGLAQSGRAALNLRGAILGGQVGYNARIEQRVVLGLEADIQLARISGQGRTSGVGLDRNVGDPAWGYDTASSTGFGSLQSRVNWLATLRQRAGYLVTPDVLVFLTGGLTLGGVDANVSSLSITNYTEYGFGAPIHWGTQVFSGGGSKSQVRVGFNAGAGAEWKLSPNWSIKGEAIYWNLGTMKVDTSTVAPPFWNSYPGWTGMMAAQATVGKARVEYQGVIARVGVNYRFDRLLASNR